MGIDELLSTPVLKTAIDVATFLVIAISAVVALVQLRHLRASNQLRALLAIQTVFGEPALQDALRFVQTELPRLLDDPKYRDGLSARGFVELGRHPELRACNFFDGLGAMLKCDLVDENGFLEMFARLAVWYWERLIPVVALMRRNRSATEYHNFEYLAIRAAMWARKHPEGAFPKGLTRLEVADPWGGGAPVPPGI